MNYLVFYLSIAVIMIVFAVIIKIKGFAINGLIIGLTTVGYSLVFDNILGCELDLFHYINNDVSNLYMVLGAVFLYPLLNILYITYLPENRRKILLYTLVWIVFMMLFEYVTILSKTIVLTGWIIFPWSIVTYIVTYSWIYILNRYVSKKCS